ncbi:hypothetical protein ACLOJK_028121 [Asimina triloba]
MERHAVALDLESSNVAKWLMLLSHGQAAAAARDEDRQQHRMAAALPAPSSSDRVFECKTCDRRFSSFQALGGHRASHKKPKASDDGHDRSRPRTHECSICGLPFAIGQALGGHMRRHRNELYVAPAAKRLKASPAGFRFDLNLTPLENDLKSALGVVGKIDAVH